MKHKWFYFTPASDGFDIIVRDTGAENGAVLAEGGVRGEDFRKFVDEVLFEGLKGLREEAVDVMKEATSKDWAGEPPEPIGGKS